MESLGEGHANVAADVYGPVTVTVEKGDTTNTVVNNVFGCNNVLGTPKNTVTVNITGLTSDHQLVRWNFSSSPENAPPVDLAWETFDGYFTITNNGGTTSESITPVFILPE